MRGNSEILVVAIMLPVLLQIAVPLIMLASYGLWAACRSLWGMLQATGFTYSPYAGRRYSLTETETDAEHLLTDNNRRVIFLRSSVQAGEGCR